jgi:hypothetical protein
MLQESAKLDGPGPLFAGVLGRGESKGIGMPCGVKCHVLSGLFLLDSQKSIIAVLNPNGQLYAAKSAVRRVVDSTWRSESRE